MQRLLRLLSRGRTGEPAARAATREDLDACVSLALDFCRERGRRVAPGARARVARFAAAFLAAEKARILVTEEAGRIAGMIWCRLGPADLWDEEPVFVVDWWYVAPERRLNGRTARALLRGAVAFGLAMGARKARICADCDSPLVARYQRTFGFRPETVNLVLTVEE